MSATMSAPAKSRPTDLVAVRSQGRDGAADESGGAGDQNLTGHLGLALRCAAAARSPGTGVARTSL